MKWLITVKKTADLDKVMGIIRDHGGYQDHDNPPIPLGDRELVIRVDGPPDLDERLKYSPDIIDVYPDSEVQLY